MRFNQLTMAARWALQFQETHAQPRDIVAFDIFCGDLNFDNCSPGGSWAGRAGAEGWLGGEGGEGRAGWGCPALLAQTWPFSLDDKMEQAHEIFSLYTDPCRIGPGQDKPWAVGGCLPPREASCLSYLQGAPPHPLRCPAKVQKAHGGGTQGDFWCSKTLPAAPGTPRERPLWHTAPG